MSTESEDDLKAISTILGALRPLDNETRVHVLDFVLKRLAISLTPGQVEGPATRPSISVPLDQHVPTAIDVRSFAAEKGPTTVTEKLAVIAFYLAHLAPVSERRDHITAEDIKPYFIQAGFELPAAQPNVTLGNAKSAGYFVAQERGQFQLNSVGHNLVAHKLPSTKRGGSTSSPKRRQTKKKARGKGKK